MAYRVCPDLIKKKKIPEAMGRIIPSNFWYDVFEYENYLI